MKYIKLIIIIIVVSCIAGFVIWQLTWMSDLKSEFGTKVKAGGTEQNEQVKADNVPHNATVNKRTADTLPGEPARVKKAPPQVEPPEMIPEKKELPEPRPVVSGAQISRETKQPLPDDRPPLSAVEPRHENDKGKAINQPLNNDGGNTRIITIKGSSKGISRGIPDHRTPQLNVNSVTQHSTSTSP